MSISFDKVSSFSGSISVPADKSISHRAFMLSAMAEGQSAVLNPLLSRDTIATMDAMKMLGADIDRIDGGFRVFSKGYRNFIEPYDIINCENSGTTARLLTGVIAPGGRYIVMTGDDSLKKRPMDRVIKPLGAMNAKICARQGGKLLPLTVMPSKMKSADITAETKSAQVKSAVILAGIQLEGTSTYVEKVQTRDHTELMLESFGINISKEGNKIIIPGDAVLKSTDITVPGDFSSAAFFIGAALMFENSEIVIHNVGLNPTRSGLISVLEGFGIKFDIEMLNKDGEPRGNITIAHQSIKGGRVDGDIIANIIDELPMLAVLGLFAEDAVEIRGAGELRVKESDRIASVVYNLTQLGADFEEYEDGIKVYPLKKLAPTPKLKAFHDHRIAMINILLAKRFGSDIILDDVACVDVSFPNFIELLSTIEA